MELLNLLNALYKGQYAVHIDGNYIAITANHWAVSIHLEEGVYSIYDNVVDDEIHLEFTDPLHLLPFVICQLKLDSEQLNYRDFCNDLAAHYQRLVAEVPVNSPYYQQYEEGYFTFWGDEHTGWARSLTGSEKWAPGAVFVEIGTGHIFQAVGGTEYDGATEFKQVWFNRETIKLEFPFQICTGDELHEVTNPEIQEALTSSFTLYEVNEALKYHHIREFSQPVYAALLERQRTLISHTHNRAKTRAHKPYAKARTLPEVNKHV